MVNKKEDTINRIINNMSTTPIFDSSIELSIKQKHLQKDIMKLHFINVNEEENKERE